MEPLRLQVHMHGSGGTYLTVCHVMVEPGWGIKEVKAAVEEQTGIPPKEQRLLLQDSGIEMRGPEVVQDLSLPAGAPLHLRLVLRPKEHVKWMASVEERGSTLSAASPAVKKDPEVALAAVKQNGRCLHYLPTSLRKNREVVLAAVKQDGYALRYAAPHLQADREVVLEAVQQSGLALHFATDSLRGDRKVVLAAAKADGLSLQFALPELRSDAEAQTVAAKGGSQEKSPRKRIHVRRDDYRWPSCSEYCTLGSMRSTSSYRKWRDCHSRWAPSGR